VLLQGAALVQDARPDPPARCLQAQTHHKDQVNEALLDKCCTLDATLQVRACLRACSGLPSSGCGPLRRCAPALGRCTPVRVCTHTEGLPCTPPHKRLLPCLRSHAAPQAINSKIGLISQVRPSEPLQRSLQAADLHRLRRRLDQIKDSYSSSAHPSPVPALPVRAQCCRCLQSQSCSLSRRRG